MPLLLQSAVPSVRSEIPRILKIKVKFRSQCLQVNLSPALAADCEADVAVKQPMLHELFDLLGMPMRHTGLSLLQGPPTVVNRYDKA